MSQFNTCPQGHFYSSTLNACPFCKTQTVPDPTVKAGGPAAGNNDRTIISGGGGNNTSAPTIPYSPNSGGSDAPTQYNPNAGGSPYQGGGSAPKMDDSDRTVIHRPATAKTADDNKSDNPAAPAHAPSSATRKIIGWLITFTHDPFGTDYRLYEGQNSIGREVGSTLRIIQDGSISSKHATILCRDLKLYLRDEMASNSSYINGTELAPGQTVEIKDGDTIKFSNTEFLLRTAFIKQ